MPKNAYLNNTKEVGIAAGVVAVTYLVAEYAVVPAIKGITAWWNTPTKTVRKTHSKKVHSKKKSA